MRNIHDISSDEVEEFDAIVRIARKKLEISVKPAMPRATQVRIPTAEAPTQRIAVSKEGVEGPLVCNGRRAFLSNEKRKALNRLKANQGSDRNLWQSPKHWISTKQQKEVTSLHFRAKGDFLHGMSAIPVRYALQNFGGEVAKKFRQSRVAKRSVQQREKKCHTLRIIQQCGDNGRRPNALSSEQLGCCAAFIDASMKSFGTAFSTHRRNSSPGM